MMLTGIVSIPCHGVNGLLLWGPFGSGKTTLSNLLPGWIEYSNTQPAMTKTLAGQCKGIAGFEHDILKLQCGQGQNGVQIMNRMEQFTAFQSYSTESGLRYMLLDEFDLLTQAAQASLKATMSSSTRIVFIMTTNHYNAIDPGVVDRSIVLDMSAAPMNAWHDKLERDYARANESFEWEKLQPIVEQGQGSCRRILSDLDKVAALRKVA
jgi:DNA polymerase III delta prime subunit